MQAINSAPAILSLFTPWSAPAPISQMEDIASKGAIPLVAWGCTSTAAVNAGQYDQLISNFAKSLKAFGHPVFLRWFWEMNLRVPKDVNCIGSAGPAGFVAAWRHVWNIFHSVEATNVALVWCPGVTGGVARMNQFFPGASYTDWIGADGYDRRSQGQPAFSDIFGSWYSAYVSYAKPMIVAETGAPPSDQAAYLQGIASLLPTHFPQVKALAYFDAPGPSGAWELTVDGLAAFRQLAADPHFAVRP